MDPAQLRAARRVTPIASVQNQLSLLHQDGRDIVDWCARDGIAFLAYSPLGSGRSGASGRTPALASIAAEHHATPAQVALAWLLTLSPVVIPIVGATTAEHVASAAAAADLTLSAADLAALSPVEAAPA